MKKSRSHWQERGMALVIVLASLVFLAALALAFLVSVNTELKSSKAYSAGFNAKLLAQSAVNLATAQIAEATKGVATNGTTLAWASQPGMIRTYDTSGNAAAYYKLYSWTDMGGDGIFDHTSATNAVPANWSSQKAIFTDLNQPLRLPSGTTNVIIFPVLDGNGIKSVTRTPGGATVPAYLTYDTDGDGKPDVEGFSVSATNVVYDPTKPPSSVNNPVPMPVKWLYVLENGQVVAPTPSAGGILATVAAASTNNSIVGRIAFWADDETCKVNINTASEGSFADAPRTYSTIDYALAQNQPVHNEFQRYPGHPATTSLSPIFGKLKNDPTFPENVYPMTPRYMAGGSKGGLVKYTAASTGLSASSTAPGFGNNRLYASVDELMFKPSLSGGLRDQNDSTILNRNALEQAKFFITASSRAPDVNLFNEPRVCIWPITLDSTGGATASPLLTPFDSLIAFCSTINHSLYYFQRQIANDSTNDLSTTGGNTGLGRNRTLLNYLRGLTALPVPGFGGTLAGKYNAANASAKGTDNDQILTEIFDYIRSTNLRDIYNGPAWAGQYTNPGGNKTHALGQVVPIQDSTTDTRGFGRFPTVQGAFLQFIGVADSTTNPNDMKNSSGVVIVPHVDPGKTRVQAAFFVQLFDPSQGVVLAQPWYQVKVKSGLGAFSWSGTTMNFPDSGSLPTPIAVNTQGITFFGGAQDYRMLCSGAGFSGNAYPLVSHRTGYAGEADDMATGGTFSFAGGDVVIEIYERPLVGTTLTLVQTVTLNFPASNFPVPKLSPGLVTTQHSSTPEVNFRTFNDLSSSIWNDSTTVRGRFNANATVPLITSDDVVESVVATPGDMRLVAGLSNVPKSMYAPHPQWGQQFAHILKSGQGAPYYGASGGKLVNVAYPGYSALYTANDVRPLTGSVTRTEMGWGFVSAKDSDVPTNTGVGALADWDTGLANLKDGSYINKTDEGDVESSSVSYFGLDFPSSNAPPGPTLFSPNRLLPSAVMFGSLPSGVFAGKPWQSLLFRPGPAGHPGLGTPSSGPPFTNPPDYLYLDLFNMPVVEPYAISEPLSTAGRINMNSQIVPFTYIGRDTGLRAVFKSEKITAIPSSAGSNSNGYKTTGNATTAPSNTATYHWPVNADATLQQFQTRFAAKDIFRSAAEICSIDLVPTDPSAPTTPTRANMDSYWNTRQLTGDNLREKPYADIYPRLTTKSNTYTIYYRAQSLQKLKTGDPKVWQEGTDKVTGEYRGSQTIERFVDPNDPNIPDYASVAGARPISDFYKFRVIQAKQFAP